MHAPTDYLAEVPSAASRILVVDDDRDLRELVVELLRSEGYAIVQAANGEEALRHLRSGAPLPHLVLLDLSMPVMDGWRCHREMQADAALAAIPVVVVSGRRDGEPAAPVPADRFLRKPFDDEAILAIVRRYCAGRSAEGSADLPRRRQTSETSLVG